MSWFRLISVASVIFATVSLSGQEKLFKDAIKQGRLRGQYYIITNTSSKYSIEDFQRVAIINSYILDSEYSTKKVSRFGDVSTVVSEIRFIPNSELYAYLFESLTNTWCNTPFSTLHEGGTASLWYYPNYKDGKKAQVQPYFFEYNHVFWSGELDENRRITGTGQGLAYDEKWVCAFIGSFHRGYPTGKVLIRWYEWKGKLRERIIESKEMTSNSGEFHDDMAWFEVDGKYGFIDAARKKLVEPKFKSVLDDFKDTYSGATNYAVVVNSDGYQWKMNRAGELFAYSDAQQKQFDEQRARAEKARLEAEAKAAEQKRLEEEKAAEERRIAQEKRLAYLAKVKANSDPRKWQRGDRLCLEFGKEGQYVTGTLEEWNGDKSKCRIKIVTSPGSRIRYNGENLEKNNMVWISSTGEGWHKALPEELEIANRDDRSTHYESIVTLKKCTDCGGTGWVKRTYHSRWFGSSTETEKCSSCNGTGLVERTQYL